jgi:hypothetical protein
MPEGPLADHRGRFHVELPGYTIEGDYDPAERPPIDAGVATDGR